MIDYTPKEHGWAMVTTSNGTTEIVFVASHLHDGRQDLIRSVATLEKYREAIVVFQDEPDGYVLHLERDNKHCYYTLHSFKNYDPTVLCELTLEGNVSLASYKNGIAEVRQHYVEITQALRTEIYYALTDLLNAHRSQNTQVLAERFDISGEFLEEIYEMLDFVGDKSVLHLPPIEEMDKGEGGGVNLEVYNFNNDGTAVGVETHLWDDQEYSAIIKGYYNLRD